MKRALLLIMQLVFGVIYLAISIIWIPLSIIMSLIVLLVGFIGYLKEKDDNCFDCFKGSIFIIIPFVCMYLNMFWDIEL
jgi:hypothetical protein